MPPFFMGNDKMSMNNDTMQQVALGYSPTQQKIINKFIKELKFMQTVPFTTATHGLFNQFEEVTNISGAQFREFDAPSVQMEIETIMQKEQLGVIGGDMSVSEERALMLTNNVKDPGKAADMYFAKRSMSILNDAGKSTERHFIYEHLYKKMFQYNNLIKSDKGKRTMFDAGGAGSNNWSIFAIRQEKEMNCGLLSPFGENNDELMTMEWLNGGQLHKITSGKDAGKIGYEAAWKAYLGYQLACPHYLGGIFNIDPDNNKMVTSDMIDDLLDAIEADPADTVLVMQRGMKTKLGRIKFGLLQLDNKEKTISTALNDWDGITIVGTNTMLRGTEEKVTMPWSA